MVRRSASILELKRESSPPRGGWVVDVDPAIILGYAISLIVLAIGIAYGLYKNRRGG